MQTLGPVVLLAPAISIVVLLVLGAKEWLMGRRSEAWQYFDRCATVLIMLASIWFLAWIAGIISAEIYGRRIDIFKLADVTNTLSEAEKKFEEMWSTAYGWIMRIGILRATFTAIPFLQPISEVLGSVLLWQNWALSIAATSLLVMVLITRIFTLIANWLLCIGATLTATDTLRKVGAGLLAVYVSTAIGIPIVANEAYRIYQGVPQPPSEMNTSYSSTVGTPKLNITCPDIIFIEKASLTRSTVIIRGIVKRVSVVIEPSELNDSVILGIHPKEGNLPLNATLEAVTTPTATLNNYTVTIKAYGEGEYVSKKLTIIVMESGRVEGVSGGTNSAINVVNIADMAAKASWKLLIAVLVSSLGLSFIAAISAGITWALGGLGVISIRRYV